MPPTAYVHLPETVHYRRDAFIKGFKRLGFHVVECQPLRPLEDGDAAVIWNRTPRSRRTVEFGKLGHGAVIVCENGYWGEDKDRHQPYAMALDGHNGSGRWYAPDGSRLEKLNIPFKPFRKLEGNHVVIADQRGIGSKQMASPRAWGDRMEMRLNTRGFHALLRSHPGPDKRFVPKLLDQLDGARCLVVWSSNCATEALVNGVPVFYDAPHIATQGCARRFNLDLVSTPFDDQSRKAAFEKMAWGQWFVDEIMSGEALRTLIDVQTGKLPSCQQGLGL